MIPVKIVGLLLLLLIWFPSLTVYGNSSNQKDLLVVKRSNGNWLPNTILSNVATAYFYKGYWYSYCEAGLIRFDGTTNKISVIPLPELKSEYPSIAGMAILNNTLWVAMRRDDGIFLFNLDQQSFAGSIKTAKDTGFGEGTNVSIIQDIFNQKIWMSSFKHLDVYDIKTGLWENLDPIFSELRIGEPSSDHKIMPDGDIIWINAPAHHRSKGGLIQLDLKRNKKVAFRKELVGSEPEPNRLDNMSLLSSPNYLWVYFDIQNGYNFYVAVYDKKSRIWKSYNRAAIIPAIELMIKELPYIKWVEKNFIIDLSRRLSEKLGNDHPYRLKPEQLTVLKSALNRLSSAYKKYNIDLSYDNYGLYDYSIHNSVIYWMNKPWVNKPIQKINIAQIRFVHLIGTTGRYVVLETNEGLAIVDPVKNTLQYMSPLTKLGGDKLDIWWSKDRKRAIIREYFFEHEEGEDYYNFISLDLESLKIYRTEKLDKHKEKEFKELPQNGIVAAAKEIILRWDGLLIKSLKNDN